MIRATQSREIILDILLEVLERGAQSHRVLRQALDKYQYLEKQDRALITRVAEGTIEYRLTIDAVLKQCSSVPVKKMKPVIRTILRMSVYQLLWMDRIPDSAVCNEAVKLAASRRFQNLKGYVNGVLRSIARQKEQFVFADWERRYSMPQWLIDRWRDSYDDATVEAMLEAFLRPAPTTVRCNRTLAEEETIIESLCAQGVRVEKSCFGGGLLTLEHYDYLESLEAFANGWIQVQDAGGALVALAAAPQPGERVLDVCGAPGGKSLQIADLLDGRGEVTVRDLTEEKLALVEDNLARTGFTNVHTQVWDARIFDESWQEGADLVIVDLPCSGLGVIGRKPEIKYQASPERIKELAALQREILTVAARYVRPGGRLVYSTCTISTEENEEQRAWFLKTQPFRSVDIRGRLGEMIREDSLKDGYVQLFPGRYPCDGFFISVFERDK